MIDKKEIVSQFGKNDKDTGSTGVQISIITKRIELLTKHIQVFKKDNSSRRGLLLLIDKRRKLLKYIKRKNNVEYLDLLNKLGLRK
ncbi:MAG: 30S ribosomal protein S15 [Thermodesulfobacteriota bacterium]|nr:30S ribosomal protein S15 [bacterium]MBT3849895.1 30S ribosomal protein S15 [bacterium]MBT4435890.1 30S ribosomal protein S15 [bacterium]MDG2445845.1 30S ribosomal protein S15 [Thermodesulfobacteriota bacterium]NSW99483.1 30S ribosomal protein S15 [bacterium]